MNIIKKLLSFVLILTLMLSILSVTAFSAAASESLTLTIKAQCLYDDAFEMLDKVNALRKAQGISTLVMDKTLLANAMQRGAELVVDFSHNRPDGSKYYTINGDIHAENIGYAYKNATEAVNGFKNSALHNTNMMNKAYKSVGIGVVEHGGRRYYTMEFCKSDADNKVTQSDNSTKAFDIKLSNTNFGFKFSLPQRFFVSDEVDIKIVGTNASDTISSSFYVDTDSLLLTSSDTDIATIEDNKIVFHNKGSVTISAKSDAVNLSKTLKVEKFADTVSNKCGDDVYFEYNNGTLTIYGSGEMYDYKTEIDNSSTVESTNLPYKDGLKYVDTVVVKDGVTKVSDNAFCGFEKLDSVSLPNSLVKIGDNAFAYCTALKTIQIPDSVTAMGENTFKRSYCLQSITLSQNLSTIPFGMAYACWGLQSINIPPQVTTIEQGAFAYCESLNKITLPQNLKNIDKLAFVGCKKISSISLPYSVQTVADKVFMDCTALKSVTANNSTTVFMEDVFSGTPDALVVYGYQGSSAQKYCSQYGISFKALQGAKLLVQASGFECEYNAQSVAGDIQLKVSNTDNFSVRYSKGKSFDYNTNFSSIGALSKYYREDITYNERIDGYLLDSGTYPVSYCVFSDGYVPYCGTVNIVITKAQPKFYFEKPYGEMFYYKGGDNKEGFLNTLLDRGSIKDEDLSFSTDNSDVVAIDWHGRAIAKSYGECTVTAEFSGNKNYYAHSTSYKLKINPVGKFKLDDIYTYEFFDDKTAAVSLYQGNLDEVTVPTQALGYKVTAVGEKAFYSRGFETLNINNGIKTIENNAFVSSYSLEKLTLGDSIEYIGDYAFSGCKQLKEVTIPYSVTHIGEKAFGFTAPDENGECQKLEDFVITGYKESAAQEYAQLHGFEFVELELPQFILGDVDNDKEVSIMDATEIQMVLALMKQWAYADAQKAADYDKDGTVSVLDATQIQLVKAGLI